MFTSVLGGKRRSPPNPSQSQPHNQRKLHRAVVVLSVRGIGHVRINETRQVGLAWLFYLLAGTWLIVDFAHPGTLYFLESCQSGSGSAVSKG